MRSNHNPKIPPAEHKRRSPHETHDRGHEHTAKTPLKMDRSKNDRLNDNHQNRTSTAAPEQRREPVNQKTAIQDLLGKAIAIPNAAGRLPRMLS